MSMLMGKGVKVNSWTQWGKLRTIMVGDATNACFEPAHQPGHIPKVNNAQQAWPLGPKETDTIEAANEELNNLASILSNQLQVDVLRPSPIDFAQAIQTPFFNVSHQYGCACPRDAVITFGNIIMEASMSRRDRYFEVFSYRDTIEELWKSDKNCLWKAAPQTSMRDDMYNHRWNELHVDEKSVHIREDIESVSYVLKPDSEIVFDAADFTRTGKHVFGQIGCTTNMNAIKWLQRELYPHGFIVHPCQFYDDLTPWHIDCSHVVLGPGLAMTNPVRPMNESAKKLWIENGWQLIEAPHPVRRDLPTYSQATEWLNMNVLVVDPETVIVEKQETAMQEFLNRHGFTNVVAVDFRNVYEFGGSIHCATWDIQRDDDQVDLFPKFNYAAYEQSLF